MGEKRKSLLSTIWETDTLWSYMSTLCPWRNMSSTTANEWDPSTKWLRWWWGVITSTPHALHDLCWAPHDLSQLSTSLIPRGMITLLTVTRLQRHFRSGQCRSSCYKQAATNWLSRSSGGASSVVRHDLECGMKDWMPAPWRSHAFPDIQGAGMSVWCGETDW